MSNNIQTLDPYMAHYVFEKQKDPNAPIVWRRFQKKMVDQVDHIVELARGNRETVTTESDWVIVGELLKFFAENWKEEFEDFKAQIPDIRRSRNNNGMSASGEIKFVAVLPPRFERIIKSIFPFQQFDKKFISKLIMKFPVFRVGGVDNMSKGRSII